MSDIKKYISIPKQWNAGFVKLKDGTLFPLKITRLGIETGDTRIIKAIEGNPDFNKLVIRVDTAQDLTRKAAIQARVEAEFAAGKQS